MASINGASFAMIWVLVDLTNSRADQLIAQGTTMMLGRVPYATVSVNRNVTNTQALVKISATDAEFRGALSAQVRAAIIRTYTEADHAEAIALVTSEAWTGPVVPGA